MNYAELQAHILDTLNRPDLTDAVVDLIADGEARLNRDRRVFQRVPALSDSAPTNWLLEDHRDIYRLAALAESAPYLKDDERLVVWETQLDRRLEDLHVHTEYESSPEYPVRPRPRPIGG